MSSLVLLNAIHLSVDGRDASELETLAHAIADVLAIPAEAASCPRERAVGSEIVAARFFRAFAAPFGLVSRDSRRRYRETTFAVRALRWQSRR
jgi:glycerol kinase